MSHRSKVDLLAGAKACGYRTYLYFIAIDDPEINVSRVRNRIAKGGHAVPEEKIVERYYRSLGYLADAIRLTDRAYLFDNTVVDEASTLVAEITGGTQFEARSDRIPNWVQVYVLEAMGATGA